MQQANTPERNVRVTMSDLYALRFSLGQKPDPSEEEQQQVRAMERLISDAITRKDIPAYSLQQIVELPVEEAERIFGPKLAELRLLEQIREAVGMRCIPHC